MKKNLLAYYSKYQPLQKLKRNILVIYEKKFKFFFGSLPKRLLQNGDYFNQVFRETRMKCDRLAPKLICAVLDHTFNFFLSGMKPIAYVEEC